MARLPMKEKPGVETSDDRRRIDPGVITASRDLDLAPLAALRLVRGTLRIDAADPSDALDDLSGLEGLERVGELLLIGLDIQTLAPLSHLAAVRPDPLADPAPITNTISRASIGITDCRRLLDLTGLENLIVWDELRQPAAARALSAHFVSLRRSRQRSRQRQPDQDHLALPGSCR